MLQEQLSSPEGNLDRAASGVEVIGTPTATPHANMSISPPAVRPFSRLVMDTPPSAILVLGVIGLAVTIGSDTLATLGGRGPWPVWTCSGTCCCWRC